MRPAGSRQEQQKPVRFPRTKVSEMPRATAVQIVCGDCAGYEVLPRKTFLTREGRCWDCGGRSYALASRLCWSLGQTLMCERIVADVHQLNEQKPEEANSYAN